MNLVKDFNITGLRLILLILLLPTSIISLPVIILWLNSKDFKPDLEGIKALRNAILSNFAAFYFTITSLFLIYLFLSNLNSIDLSGVFALMNSSKPMKFKSIDGNILSLASIYFSLAIGGTVVFTVLSRHNKQIEEIKTKIDELKTVYIKWIEADRLSDKIFNLKKAKSFYAIVNDLRNKVEPANINKLKEPIRFFDFFLYLVLIYYFMGVLLISVISTNDFLINLAYVFGWASMFPYIIILFTIFKHYQDVAH